MGDKKDYFHKLEKALKENLKKRKKFRKKIRKKKLENNDSSIR